MPVAPPISCTRLKESHFGHFLMFIVAMGTCKLFKLSLKFINMSRYYIDACIWRDYFENRSDNLRPLGEWAFRLIKKIISENGLIICSSLILKELGKEYSEKQIMNILSIVPCSLLIDIKISASQFKEAKSLSIQLRTPLKDTIHAIMARDNNAVMVTRDKHFIELNKIAAVRKPEDLI